MGALESTLGMLGTFAFGRALSGLRGLGSTPSAFAGLMEIGESHIGRRVIVRNVSGSEAPQPGVIDAENLDYVTIRLRNGSHVSRDVENLGKNWDFAKGGLLGLLGLGQRLPRVGDRVAVRGTTGYETRITAVRADGVTIRLDDGTEMDFTMDERGDGWEGAWETHPEYIGFYGLPKRRSASLSSAFAGLGGPMSENERKLDRALSRLLRDYASQIRAYSGKFGVVEGDELVQRALIKIVNQARKAPQFQTNPEKWIAEKVQIAYLITAIRSAAFDFAKSSDVRTRQQQILRDKEGGELEREVADPEAGAGFTEQQVSFRREYPALLKQLTRGLDKEREEQVRDLVSLGAQARDKVERRVPPVSQAIMRRWTDGMRRDHQARLSEARFIEYGKAARIWTGKHPNAVPYEKKDENGEPYWDAVRFQKDLIGAMTQMRKIAKGRGSARTVEQGVFLSDKRTRGVIVPADIDVDLDLPAGKRRYVRPPSAFVNELFTRGKEKSAREKAKILRRERREAERTDKTEAPADARTVRVDAKLKELDEKRVAKSAGDIKAQKDEIDAAAQLLLKKRNELAAMADKLSPDELSKRRAVLDSMAEGLAQKRAAVATAAMRQSRGGIMERQSQAVPSAPSFADSIMAIKAVDAEDAKAEAYNAQQEKLAETKAKSGVSGLSAFAGLLGFNRKSARRSRR